MRGWQPFCRIEARRGSCGPFALDKRIENFLLLAAMSFQMCCESRGKAANRIAASRIHVCSKTFSNSVFSPRKMCRPLPFCLSMCHQRRIFSFARCFAESCPASADDQSASALDPEPGGRKQPPLAAPRLSAIFAPGEAAEITMRL